MMAAARLFVVNSLLSTRLIPVALRGRLYRFLGLKSLGRFSFGIYFGSLQVRIGERTYVNARCFFDAFSDISIGDDCLIGMEALFLTSSHGIERLGVYGPPVGKPIVVGNRCWIGARAVIMPNVKICDNVVIGAGAVVTKSVVESGVYTGIPARKTDSTVPSRYGSG